MTLTTAPPTPTPTVDPLRAALDDTTVRERLRVRVLVKLGRWLQGAPIARRQEEADEIVAETLQRAWAGQAKYDPARPVIGWLQGILTNVLHEYSRRFKKQPQQLINVDLPDREAVARFEDQELLALVLDRLTPDERNLVEWSMHEGLSYQQIAERMQITEGNARLRLHRLKAQLRRKLQMEGQR